MQWAETIKQLVLFEKKELDRKIQAEPTAVFQGGLEGGHLRNRRLFVSLYRGEIEGFLICNPFDNGQGWSIETYRNRSDGVRGSIYFLIFKALEVFKQEGVTDISLCIVPGINCDQPLPGDSALCRRFMSLWSKHLGFLANIRGSIFLEQDFAPLRCRYIFVFIRRSHLALPMLF